MQVKTGNKKGRKPPFHGVSVRLNDAIKSALLIKVANKLDHHLAVG